MVRFYRPGWPHAPGSDSRSGLRVPLVVCSRLTSQPNGSQSSTYPLAGDTNRTRSCQPQQTQEEEYTPLPTCDRFGLALDFLHILFYKMRTGLPPSLTSLRPGVHIERAGLSFLVSHSPSFRQ